MTNDKIAILLVNTGSPKSPKKEDVKKYLKEFLMDKHILNMPFFLRFLLVNFIILPIRSKKSAKNYGLIYDEEKKMPLHFYTKSFANKLDKIFENKNEKSVKSVKIFHSYLYAQENIENAVNKIKQDDIKKILVFPMFPQSSYATWGAVKGAFENKSLKKITKNLQIYFAKEFYNEELYIDALAQKVKNYLQKSPKSRLVFSFHSVPSKYNLIDKKMGKVPYQNQCQITASLVAKKLNLSKNDFTISYQSRFDSRKWISPFTKDILQQKDIVLTPSFLTDCLESIFEIALEEKASLIPCLNDDDNWVENFSKILLKNLNSIE